MERRINPRARSCGTHYRWVVLHRLTATERSALADCLPPEGLDLRCDPGAPYQPTELSGASHRLRTLAETLHPRQPELAELLSRLSRGRRPTTFRHARGTLSLSRPLVMGVINVTPDSFSDGGKWLSADDAVAHGLRLVAEGADILDVGGESTRPGAPPVGMPEELDRVIPVIRALAERTDVPISIDTSKPSVARAAMINGAAIINDVTGLSDDMMASVAATHEAGVVLMHTQGLPETMQDDPAYQDVLYEVTAYWRERLRDAAAAGIAAERILLDPGIGFGKTLDHNLTLLRRLPELASLGHGLLLGTSRKSFIKRGLETLWQDRAPAGCSQTEAADRVWGTAASVACAVAAGVSAIRVHDVAQMRQVADLASLVRDGGGTR